MCPVSFSVTWLCINADTLVYPIAKALYYLFLSNNVWSDHESVMVFVHVLSVLKSKPGSPLTDL